MGVGGGDLAGADGGLLGRGPWKAEGCRGREAGAGLLSLPLPMPLQFFVLLLLVFLLEATVAILFFAYSDKVGAPLPTRPWEWMLAVGNPTPWVGGSGRFTGWRDGARGWGLSAAAGQACRGRCGPPARPSPQLPLPSRQAGGSGQTPDSHSLVRSFIHVGGFTHASFSGQP